MRTLTAVPVGLFSFNYDVLEGDAQVGSIENRAAFLQIKGTLRSGGKELFTRREGAFRACYLLETQAGAVVARAQKIMALAEEYEVSYGERVIHLRKKVMAMRETFIISSDAGGIGSIVQESLMSRRMRCEIDAPAAALPQEIALFLIWMALIIRKKDAASSS